MMKNETDKKAIKNITAAVSSDLDNKSHNKTTAKTLKGLLGGGQHCCALKLDEL